MGESASFPYRSANRVVPNSVLIHDRSAFRQAERGNCSPRLQVATHGFHYFEDTRNTVCVLEGMCGMFIFSR